MKRFTAVALAAVLGSSAMAKETSPKGFYSLQAKSIEGKASELKDYSGKVALVVNTASKCGYTPQYEALEALYKKYKDRGLVVLGFPSNDFGNQEPGSDGEIKKFCQVNFNIDFPMFAKGPVKGDAKQPVYRFLTEHAPKGSTGEVKWNFEKFLIARNGEVVGRFGSSVKPDDGELTRSIEKQLAAGSVN